MIDSSSISSAEKDELFFVTLKTSREINQNSATTKLFDHKEYSDIFVKALIYLIERCSLNLYGFVILSDQIHLIVDSPENDMHEKIEKLKRVSAREILQLIGKKLIAMDEPVSRKNMELRKLFGKYLNTDESIFWAQNEVFLPIQRLGISKEIYTISSSTLMEHLVDSKRNYLQLGASAFTKLMMETM